MAYGFVPSEEQKMLIDVVNRYAASDLRPKGRDAEEGDDFSTRLINKGWELGVLQASMPETYGGFGERSVVTSALALEELAWGDLAGALAILTPGLFATPVLLSGSEAQKEQFLPEIIENAWQPYTAALIEPVFDYDPLELKTTAKLEGGHFVLTGKKAFVPYADKASHILVYANLDGNTQGFIVPADAEGLTIHPRHQQLGINGLPMNQLELADVRVPASARLGGETGHDFQPILDSMRVGLASLAVGLSRAAFEYARDYAKEREAFGVRIAQKQAIAFMLAEMATEIEAIRLLVWEAAWKIDANKPDAGKHAYLAHTGAIDMAMTVTDRAVQILGGHGYIREYPVEMWMRSGRGIASLLGLAIA